MRARYKFVKTWIQAGIPYARFVKKGMAPVMLPGAYGSPEFMLAYMTALNHGTPVTPREPGTVGAKRTQTGTVNAAVVLFLQSSAFTSKSVGTQKQRRPILERFRELHGDKPLALLQRKDLERMLQELGPHAARNWLKTLRPLMEFCVKAELCEVDPTLGIKAKVPKSRGHETWTEDEIAQFRAYWTVGTMERLAMELALNTGQRGSDLVRMGRQHVRQNAIIVRHQQKTDVKVTVPITPELAAVIAGTPTVDGNLTYLTNERKRPFTANGFSSWFSNVARAAGLPAGYTAHGLRKGCCKRLADAGCTASEIQSISGHLTLAEVQRYCAEFDREKGSARAMAKLAAGTV